ncbi:hypothetical protein BKA65DRAFT_575846 [Rhexocercosporidium sp. MPI-PUGE-AT-0058]|nr:hypothetical protein BKA65DRAFT_575846 [Rhexocercosporidium sp. MPI-PUGE-AT-0058]
MASSKHDPVSYQWINPARPLPSVNDNIRSPSATSSLQGTESSASIPSNQSTPAATPSLRANENASSIGSFPIPQKGNTSTSTKSATTSHAGVSMRSAEHELTEFTYFPKLPLELRNMIFTSACSEPRIIDLWAVGIGSTDDVETADIPADQWLFRFRSQAERPPSLLHTSQEARTISLKHYTLAFNTSFTRYVGVTETKVVNPARVWVNWDYDIICPMPDLHHHDKLTNNFIQDFANRVCKLEVKHSKIRRLAIEASNTMAGPNMANILGLEELILYPSFCQEKLSGLHNGTLSVKNSINFELVPIKHETNDLRSRQILNCALAMKRRAECLMEKMIERVSLSRWGTLARMPVDWEMPEIKLSILSIEVDNQEYDISQ